MTQATREVYFITFLENVDSSILNLELEHGFKVDSFDEPRFIDFMSTLDKSTDLGFKGKNISLECLNRNDKRAYFISNSFFVKYFLKEGQEFYNTFYVGYLSPLIRKAKLFKEGNISIPFGYFHCGEGSHFRPSMTIALNQYTRPVPFMLEEDEAKPFSKFLRDFKFPLDKPYLQLAFENFEESYHVHGNDLAFLLNMIALEILFNDGPMELKYKISRNAAVLLGKNIDDFKIIFKDIKSLYDLRSGLVHSGISNKIKDDDLIRLQDYIRRSIKKIADLKLDKKELIDFLNSKGF
ncbi:MAG: HEPN domain-containing protein [Candidatus Nanoarchaeia archaeon]|nr:HEPN domain-containing protein [Candidatus Nanoarchaeia archaeon]